MDTLIGGNGFVYENGKEPVLRPELCGFEEVILVLREELPDQAVGGFAKVKKSLLFHWKQGFS